MSYLKRWITLVLESTKASYDPRIMKFRPPILPSESVSTDTETSKLKSKVQIEQNLANEHDKHKEQEQKNDKFKEKDQKFGQKNGNSETAKSMLSFEWNSEIAATDKNVISAMIDDASLNEDFRSEDTILNVISDIVNERCKYHFVEEGKDDSDEFVPRNSIQDWNNVRSSLYRGIASQHISHVMEQSVRINNEAHTLFSRSVLKGASTADLDTEQTRSNVRLRIHHLGSQGKEDLKAKNTVLNDARNALTVRISLCKASIEETMPTFVQGIIGALGALICFYVLGEISSGQGSNSKSEKGSHYVSDKDNHHKSHENGDRNHHGKSNSPDDLQKPLNRIFGKRVKKVEKSPFPENRNDSNPTTTTTTKTTTTTNDNENDNDEAQSSDQRLLEKELVIDHPSDGGTLLEDENDLLSRLPSNLSDSKAFLTKDNNSSLSSLPSSNNDSYTVNIELPPPSLPKPTNKQP